MTSARQLSVALTFCVSNTIRFIILYIFQRRFFFDHSIALFFFQMIFNVLALLGFDFVCNILRRRVKIISSTALKFTPDASLLLLSAAFCVASVFIRNQENGWLVPGYHAITRVLPVVVYFIDPAVPKTVPRAALILTISLGSMFATEAELENFYYPKPVLGFIYSSITMLVLVRYFLSLGGWNTSKVLPSREVSTANLFFNVSLCSLAILPLIDVFGGFYELRTAIDYIFIQQWLSVAFFVMLGIAFVTDFIAQLALFSFVRENGSLNGAILFIAQPLCSSLIGVSTGFSILVFPRNYLGYLVCLGATWFWFWSNRHASVKNTDTGKRYSFANGSVKENGAVDRLIE